MNLDNNENDGLEQLKSFCNFINCINNNNINFLNNINLNVYEMFSIIKPFLSKFESSCCIINGKIKILDDIYKLGLENFKTYVKQNMPTKLYRYYSMKNEYGIQALENNTVYLQNPENFDDVFDSESCFNYSDFLYLRLKKYCELFGVETHNLSVEQLESAFLIRLNEYYNANGNFNEIISKIDKSNIIDYDMILLYLFINSLVKNIIKGETNIVVSKAIREEYSSHMNRLKMFFGSTCFATNPYLQLMWSIYADCHKGFCIEYDIKPDVVKYNDIYENLFPIIYSKVRSTLPSKILENNYLNLTEDYLWNIYLCGALRKSIDWVWQDEWRLLLPFQKKVNIEFFPISKVFLGNKMSTENKKLIIDICNGRKIDYIGIKRDDSSFDLKECNIKCEDCPDYKEKLKKISNTVK